MSDASGDLLRRVTANGRVITLLYSDGEDREAADVLIERIESWIDSHDKMSDSQSIAIGFGFWEVAVRSDGQVLDVWEPAPEGNTLVRGATLALRFWRLQRATCDHYKTAFEPPAFRQMIVTSAGVAEGDVVQGVRYPSPPHMSGWWITTDRYNGDLKTLTIDHAFHIAAQRPDLVPFLALPAGYRFDFQRFEDVWFDDAIANGSNDGTRLTTAN